MDDEETYQIVFCTCGFIVLFVKGGEIRDTKTLNLSRNKNICCGLKKVVAQSRARTGATNFGFVVRFSSNSQLVTQQICCDAAILDAH